MRKLTKFLALMILAVASLQMSSDGQAAYTMSSTGPITLTSGTAFTIQNQIGALNFSLEYKITGGPATVSITAQGCMAGGTCQTIDSYSGTANAIRTITGLYNSIIITPTFTGGTNPTLVFNAYGSANSAPSILSFQYINITSNTSTQVKTGSGFFHAFIVSTKGATGNTATVFDNSACSGTKIATIDTTASGATYIYDVQFNTGLCITTATGTAGDFTVSFR